MLADILIVGGEGDLAYRKLYPSLYRLHCGGHLGDGYRVIGVARNAIDEDDFKNRVRSKLTEFVKEDPKVSQWAEFSQALHYLAIDATAGEDVERLHETLLQDSARDLIVYLATPPTIFAPICQALESASLVRPNTRIVVEKPLGESRESFLKINDDLTSIFDESQVYRIDHYLGKETVQNLLALRFANVMFEPLWNQKYIDHVQITVAETVGAEGRWSFYDEAGALRDMLQNHMLQLLCLTAMEPPSSTDADAVRDEKLKVLRCLHRYTPEDVHVNTVRGQYTAGAVDGEPVVGYLQEDGAAATSGTETFVAVKAHLDNWRWAGVPFYLRSGKRLTKRYSEIVIQFKRIPHSIFRTVGISEPNSLVIRLQPEEGISLQLLNKLPGLQPDAPMEKVALDLSFSEAFNKGRVPDAYERLLLDVIAANPTLFVRADEVEAAWRWVDDIIDGWQKTGKRVDSYTAGGWGPSSSVALIAKDGRDWHEYVERN